MKLVSFDIETASIVSDHDKNWSEQLNLGISCAAIAFSDRDDTISWSGNPQLTQEEARQVVQYLNELSSSGYSLVTWNGCAFDFRVLAEESGLVQKAAQLAMSHTDLMMIVTFTKGWFLGLDKALQGAGLSGKLHKVRLSDGTVLKEMDGAKAPLLWAKGEKEAVLNYLEQDVRQLLDLTQVVLQRSKIAWTSNSGRPQSIRLKKLYTVKECFDLPEPDTSWMTNPPSRNQFVKWMK